MLGTMAGHLATWVLESTTEPAQMQGEENKPPSLKEFVAIFIRPHSPNPKLIHYCILLRDYGHLTHIILCNAKKSPRLEGAATLFPR